MRELEKCRQILWPNNNTLKTIKVPFTGFYDSVHGLYFEQYCKDITELLKGDKQESFIYNFKGYMDAYAKEYIALVEQELLNCFGIEVVLKFKEVLSPTEYNFENDCILAEITMGDVIALFEACDLQSLRGWVEDAFTPRSGFSPYFSNCLDDWLSKGYGQWESVELGAILEVMVDSSDMSCENGQEIAMEFIQ